MTDGSSAPRLSLRVIGIDVGGPTKGFHAVTLDGLDIVARWQGSDVTLLADWCVEQKAVVAAVDAPCRWRGPDLARAAERELAAEGISCYYAPTERRAREHAFYQWMLPGADLYRALADRFPLYLGGAVTGPVAIETFPQAVACALAGKIVSAKPKEKRAVRRELLQRAGIALSGDENTDELDALLCAMTALGFALGKFKAYGDAEGGFIIVPVSSLSARPVIAPAPPTYTPLKHHLQDWVDIDVAQFHLARCLGVLGPDISTMASAKWVFWSNNPTGNLLFQMLRDMAGAGFLEINEEEFKIRWKPDQPSEKP
jgi:predicted RNase H-like nuclease